MTVEENHPLMHAQTRKYELNEIIDKNGKLFREICAKEQAGEEINYDLKVHYREIIENAYGEMDLVLRQIEAYDY
jgi:hypothetical protein